MAQDFARVSTFGGYLPYGFSATRSSALVAPDHTHGTFLGTVVINQAGTNDVITLANGTTVFANIKPVAGATYEFYNKCNSGLFVTITGTAGDYTINASPMAV